MLSSEITKKKTSAISKDHKAASNKTKNGTAKKAGTKKVAATKNKTAAAKKTKKSTPTPAVVKKEDPTEVGSDSLSQLDSIDQKLGSATKMTEEQKHDKKWMERHPDITGLMGGSKSNKPDKDEEDMMNDIGGDLAVSAKVSSPSSHEDTFDR